jgi:phosphonoacetaldehyde hydrolase
MRRPYRDRLQAVILDWAGTTVDHGSVAPIRVLQKIFADRGIEVTDEEVRRDMGILKKDHLRSLLHIPRIAGLWEKRYQKVPGESELENLFAEFIPQQMESLAQYSTVIAGIPSAVERLRARGLKIGSTTGYTRPLLDILLPHAAGQGYRPDCALCPDDVGAGRPLPWMIYENAVRLKVYPIEAVVKIGDTISDVEEGLNAGTWAVAVTRTGNMIGLTEDEWRRLPQPERAVRLRDARRKFLEAGAHYVIDSMADIDEIVNQIEFRLRAGERP